MNEKMKDFFMKTPTGVVTDALDILGINGWMEGVFPLRPEGKLFGRAFTIQASPFVSKGQKNYQYFDLAPEFKEGDIVVIDGLGANYSLMGENNATFCMCNGVAGAVLDGYCRDFAQVRDIEMPVFAKGPTMRIRGGHIAFTEYNVPINCAGARVCPGDYVLGDIDGVLVFSADRVEQIMELMEKIIVIEDEIMAEIINKEDPQKIKATLQKVKALKSKLV